MEPHILFRGHHDALLNDLVHPRGGGFRVVQRRGTLWRQDNQFITFTVRFAARDEGHDAGFGHFRQHPGAGGGRRLVDRKQWGKDAGGRAVIVIRCVPHHFAFFQCPDHAFQILTVNHILIGAQAAPGLQPVDH